MPETDGAVERFQFSPASSQRPLSQADKKTIIESFTPKR